MLILKKQLILLHGLIICYLSGHMWSATKVWDPEGILSTLPAIGTALIGILTGVLASK